MKLGRLVNILYKQLLVLIPCFTFAAKSVNRKQLTADHKF